MSGEIYNSESGEINNCGRNIPIYKPGCKMRDVTTCNTIAPVLHEKTKYDCTP